MFEAQLSVDSVFDMLGIDAVIDPDGVAMPVRLLPSEEDQEARFSTVEIVDAGGVYEIRIADFQGHGDGAILSVSGQRRRVQSHKVLDQRRLKVTLNTVETA